MAAALAVAVVATPPVDRIWTSERTEQVPGAVGAPPAAPPTRLSQVGPVVAFAPLPVRQAPANLPAITYTKRAPRGFPADRQSGSTAALTRGLQPTTPLPVYDAPGGHPRAFLTPRISGVKVTVPIVGQDRGWVAVLLPSVNRRIGWLPKGGWSTVTLRDQLIINRGAHRLTWLRDGKRRKTWPVTLGTGRSPTPLGRTFVLGRSRLYGSVYANTDVFALGAVPDRPDSVPTALRGAHIGIHTWYHDRELGKNTSDGCIRLTRSGQRELLANLRPGTPVVVKP
jgi:lipoprotein-anchoring transpeptidase ErfK/SrfK